MGRTHPSAPHVCPPGHPHAETTMCYRAHRCRCASCRARRATDSRAQSQRVRTGEAQVFMPPESVIPHVRELMRNGWRYADIAKVSGVAVPTIQRIMVGRTRRVEQETALALLGTTPNMRHRIVGKDSVDATGTIRRLRALAALGWSFPTLSARLGRTRGYVANLVSQRFVTVHTRDMVANLYDELWDQLPQPVTPTERAVAKRQREHAQAMGWSPPLAWDDIDNDVTPPTVDRDTDRAAWVIEELHQFHEAGESVHFALTALNRSAESTARLANRHGRNDLARWIDTEIKDAA